MPNVRRVRAVSLMLAAVLGADKQPIAHAVISQLPVPDAGFLGLLAASGAGYLVYKGMSHSKEGP